MTPRAPPPPPAPRHHLLLLADAVASWHPFLPSRKKPCFSDRSTSPAPVSDLSKLSLLDDPPPSGGGGGGAFRWLGPRKRRRRGGGGSRSVSGRSSDRRRSGTCSDFPITAAGGGGATDSSGEMWASDVGEARMRDTPVAPEFVPPPCAGAVGAAMGAVAEVQASESGYGSEPGYRGDVELGYDDGIDEEEEDGKQQLFFWGDQIGDISEMGIVGDSNFGEQKSHHRCRRKKHDVRMLAPLR